MKAPNSEIVQGVFRTHRLRVPKFQRFKRHGARDSYGLLIPGRVAFSIWEALYKQRERVGYYPLLMNASAWFEQDGFKEASVDQRVESGLALSPQRWFSKLRAENPKLFKNKAYRGSWPEKKAGAQLSVAEKIH